MLDPHAILLLLAFAQSGCTKDTDCKGDRICEAGRCVSPQAPAPTPAPEPLSLPPPPSIDGAPVPDKTPLVPTEQQTWARQDRANRVRGELADLQRDYDDQTYGGPIFKLTGALAGLAVGVTCLVFALLPRGYSWDNSGYLVGAAAGFVIGGGLGAWGGVQLWNRAAERERLKPEIEKKKAQLAELDAY